MLIHGFVVYWIRERRALRIYLQSYNVIFSSLKIISITFFWENFKTWKIFLFSINPENESYHKLSKIGVYRVDLKHFWSQKNFQKSSFGHPFILGKFEKVKNWTSSIEPRKTLNHTISKSAALRIHLKKILKSKKFPKKVI